MEGKFGPLLGVLGPAGPGVAGPLGPGDPGLGDPGAGPEGAGAPGPAGPPPTGGAMRGAQTISNGSAAAGEAEKRPRITARSVWWNMRSFSCGSEERVLSRVLQRSRRVGESGGERRCGGDLARFRSDRSRGDAHDRTLTSRAVTGGRVAADCPTCAGADRDSTPAVSRAAARSVEGVSADPVRTTVPCNRRRSIPTRRRRRCPQRPSCAIRRDR